MVSWTELCETHTPFELSVVWTWTLSVVVYWYVQQRAAVHAVPLICRLCGLFYIGLGRLTWAQPYRLQPTTAAKVKQPGWTRLIATLLFNQVVVILPMSLLLYLPQYFSWSGIGLNLDCNHVPSLPELGWQIAFFTAVEEVLFYYAHRLAHTPALYGPVHKMHHEFQAPNALCANFAHPLEVALCNVLPLLTGPLLVRAHLLTAWLWFTLATISTQTHHCGFRFPWTPAFDIHPDFHDFHHERFVGNYGLLGVCDWLHGTDSAWRAKLKKLK